MNSFPGYYILVGRIPIAVDLMTWAKAGEERHRKARIKPYDPKNDPWKVGHTIIDKHCHVSTVFLGLDHNFFSGGDPILFETMIFGGPLNDEQWRYATWAEAERGHAEAVVQASKACAQVKAIANAVGLTS